MEYLIAGTSIGNYVIQGKLGEGGMGTVYQGVDSHLDRPVAIKVLHPALARDPSVAERFRAEARAQANLNHHNVATLYSFVAENDNAMMVMEYIDGETFQQIIKSRGPMPTAEALSLFKQALAGIGAAHRMGIIHRDIKPSNLMLNQFGVVKVMDFGIAKVTGNQGLTRTGFQLGTLYYMSPEQIKGEPLDTRSDIYALGITLYQMLTARLPFESDSEFQILTDHVNTPPPPPRQFRSDIPDRVQNVILKALEKKPADRFATVEEFATALDAVEQDSPQVPLNVSASIAPLASSTLAHPAGEAPVAAPPIPSKNNLPRLLIAASAVILIGIIAAGILLVRSNKQPMTAATKTAQPDIASVQQPQPKPTSGSQPTAAAGSLAPAVVPKPEKVEFLIPAGSTIAVQLLKGIDANSEASAQMLAARVTAPLTIGGRTVIPVGAFARVEAVNSGKEGILHRSSHVVLTLRDVRIAEHTYPLAIQKEVLLAADAVKGNKFFGKIESVVGGVAHPKKSPADADVPVNTPETIPSLGPGTRLHFTVPKPLSIGVFQPPQQAVSGSDK